jgi:hypothetical protein
MPREDRLNPGVASFRPARGAGRSGGPPVDGDLGREGKGGRGGL